MTDLVKDDVHRTMSYIHGTASNGYAPSVAEVEAYATSPDRRFSRSGGSISQTAASLGRFADTVFGSGTHENFIDYLRRLSWVDVKEGAVRLSLLGEAVLRAADADAISDNEPVLQTVVIEPNDAFAYARTMAIIADMTDVLVVDPYLKLAEVIELSQLSTVSRIMTGDEGRDASRKGVPFSQVVAATSRSLELRIGPNAGMHDRYLLPASGAVKQVSTSLNSVGKRIGVITILSDVASAAVREECERLWREAIDVSTTPDQQPADSASSGVSAEGLK